MFLNLPCSVLLQHFTNSSYRVHYYLPCRYRDAGCEVVDVFCQFSDCVQRASVDEAYIDITETVEQRISSFCRVQSSQLATTFVVGFTDTNSNDEG
jgi:DNA polymerase eta